MTKIHDMDDGELPPMSSDQARFSPGSVLNNLFGGTTIERRPAALATAAGMITAAGFVVGTLFTMAILSGFIEIDPKAIKTMIKGLFGNS